MKIEIIGHTYTVRDPATKKRTTYEPGKPFDLDDKEAGRLIALGFAKKAGSAPTPPAETQPPKPEQKAGGSK